MDLHPYDNVIRRYRHSDESQHAGRAALAQVLRLPQAPAGELLFDLSFFSGGAGVLDRLAITLPADPPLWATVADALRGRTPEAADADATWAGDLLWLLTGAEESVPIRPAAVDFINQLRREFQSECLPANQILFEHESNVNDWGALWGDATQLNYLGYSQG